MNILIIGEYSAFAKHLKNGFKQLGHNVTIVTNGDGWKTITGDSDDINYDEKKLKIFGKVVRGSQYLRAIFTNRHILNQINKHSYELIFVVNFHFLRNLSPFRVGIPLRFIKRRIKKGTKLIMSACGGDPALFYTYPDYYKMIGAVEKLYDIRYDFLLKNSDIIIPTCYTYWYAVANYCNKFGYNAKINNSIALPITIEKNYVLKSCIGRKIVIFHGISRPVHKGTMFIKEAMDRLQKDYPDLVVCICKDRMPYSEYIKLFDEIDILIDQTLKIGNGWGINAAIGAMKAKCVLTPCKKENEEQMGIPNLPFVYIKPDSDQIYNTLKELILNPQRIDEIKLHSREIAEKYFDCKIVAQRYLDTVALK